ncbi:MAG: glycine--tRNA ligase subunit beta [Proteobacteria bacterium]|nr:glycine--tRNA ligase subunit beta [Pseudomonadota bacterium]
MSELFIELISEEIPAGLQAWGERRLAEGVMTGLAGNGLGGEVAEVWSTPRRLAVAVRGVAAGREARSIETRGPRLDADPAIVAKFAEAQGLAVADLAQKTTDKGQFYFAIHNHPAEATGELLPGIINPLLANFGWAKNQRWRYTQHAWVRPLHRINVIFDGKQVVGKYDLGGGEVVVYGDASMGHRYGHVAAEHIVLTGRKDLGGQYYRLLQARHVIVSREARKRMIAEQITQLAESHKFMLVEDVRLLDEVVGLVEYPHALMGRIDDEFMDLPEEILILAMRSHQKYFAVTEKSGRLAPAFITISNMVADSKRDAVIRTGNERVLRARLNDARFLWEEDKRTPLADYAKRLGDMTYIEGRGSMADCVGRIADIAIGLAQSGDQEKVKQITGLMKADLATGCVNEFPALQGVVGGLLGREHGLAEDIATAIAEHYKPLGGADSIPSTPLGQVVAVADKIERLQSFFAIGKKPTGSSDPFGLRRAVHGIIRIALEGQQGFALDWADEAVMEFLVSRLRIFCVEHKNMRLDCVRAVVTDFRLAKLGIAQVVARTQRLQAFANTRDGREFLAAFKRIASILADEAKKGKIKDGASMGKAKADSTLFLDDSEEKLYAGLQAMQKNAEDDETLLAVMKQSHGAINRFFEAVKVNADDAKVRKNRLALLGEIHALCTGFADFSAIQDKPIATEESRRAKVGV